MDRCFVDLWRHLGVQLPAALVLQAVTGGVAFLVVDALEPSGSSANPEELQGAGVAP